jgi:transcriptional regulator with XRE-family HTH domain
LAKRVYTNSVLDAVDDSSVEASLKEKAIGPKIRRLRLKRSMSLIELGKRTALSASFISQLETGRVIPTLRNLARISMVFEKELSYFFLEEEGPSFRTSHAKDRIRLPIEEKNSPRVISESLSALVPDRRIVPCVAEFLPGIEDAAFDPPIFQGLELVYIIHGSLAVSTKTENQQLRAGDSVWIDGNAKRRYQCHGGAPTKAMIITFSKQL